MTSPSASSHARSTTDSEPTNFEPIVDQQKQQVQPTETEEDADCLLPLPSQEALVEGGLVGPTPRHAIDDVASNKSSNGGASAPVVDGDSTPVVPCAPDVPSPGKRSGSESPFRLSMPMLSPGQLAFTALQFLPVPVLVLNNLKTVVLANDAMGRMLGMAGDDTHDFQQDEPSFTDKLRGQTLSQVGIDMLQDGRPVWISWDSFFDELIAEVGTKHVAEPSIVKLGSQECNTVPKVADPASSGASGNPGKPASDSAVNVVVLARGVDRTTVPNSKTSDHQTLAKMIITIWEIEDGQIYYTLAFTNAESAAPHLPGPRISVARSWTLEAAERKTIPRSSPPSVCSSQCSNSPSVGLSPAAVSISTSPFPPMGPPPRLLQSNTPSSLQKMTIIKDALLDSTEMPILAMWKDGSSPVLNSAARRLFSESSGTECLDGQDLLNIWDVWDDTFTRKIDPSDNPLAVLLKEQKPFSGIRVGTHHKSTDSRRVYDILGEVITDDETGEFIAGVITCRDVTHLTQEITQIKEADDERFRLICDTMPQMVWTAGPDGMHDFFNNRWYDYTGLSPEESLGTGWMHPFHPDDMPETERKWKHCLATGDPYATEYRCLSKEGEWRWMLGRALPLKNKRTGKIEKWFGTCTDVHETLEAKVDAKRTRDELQQVLRHAQTTIFSVDRERKVTMLEGALIMDGENDCAPNEDLQRYIGRDVDHVFNDLNLRLPQSEVPAFLTPVNQLLSGKEPGGTVLEHEISEFCSNETPLVG